MVVSVFGARVFRFDGIDELLLDVVVGGQLAYGKKQFDRKKRRAKNTPVSLAAVECGISERNDANSRRRQVRTWTVRGVLARGV